MPAHSPAPNAPIRNETVQTCPRCGGGSLHHCEIIVYDREDDAALVRRTRVNNGRVALDVVPEGPANPSSRRNGLTISFYCENCSASPGDLVLTVAQHKGSTMVGWRYDDKTA